MHALGILQYPAEMLLAVLSQILLHELASGLVVRDYKSLEVLSSGWHVNQTSASYPSLGLCSLFCIMESCASFQLEAGSGLCKLGSFDPHVLEARKVGFIAYYVGESPLKKRILQLDYDASVVTDYSVETETVLASSPIASPNLAHPIGGFYKNGFLVCDGATKVCKHISLGDPGNPTNVADLQYVHADTACPVSILDRVWIIGGRSVHSNYDYPSDQVEIYGDTDSDAWTDGPTAPERLDVSASVVLSHTEFMICSGLDLAAWVYHKRCYKMNALTRDGWTPLADLNVGASLISLVRFRSNDGNKKVIAVGGYTDNSELTDRVEIYDVATDTWELQAGLTFPTATTALMGVSIDDRKVLWIGGERETEIYEYVIDTNTFVKLDAVANGKGSKFIAVFN